MALKLKDSEEFKDIYKDLIITKEEMEKEEKELFDFYLEKFNDPQTNSSSSFYYMLSRFYNRKVGNDGDKLMEFICMKKASEMDELYPGTGSIMSFYRKYKASNVLEQNKNEYKEAIQKIEKGDSEGYGDNGNLCPICYTNERNHICLPCKHLFCEGCLDNLDEHKCPICRNNILTTADLSV